MKIAFLSLNRETLPDPGIPLGLLYVMANAPPEHTRALWDLCFEADPVAHTRARIRSFQPDLIAVGTRNIQNNDYSGCETNLRDYAQIFATIRAATRAPVVLGGGVNFDEALFRVPRRTGHTGPLWRHIDLADQDTRGRRRG